MNGINSILNSLGARFGFFALASLLCLLIMISSLAIGRFDVSLGTAVSILIDNLIPIQGVSWGLAEERVVELVRLPRILVAGIAGAGLGVAGAALQSLFRNPLVAPDILGIAPGAGFGGALAIMFVATSWATVLSSFVFGLIAIVLVMSVARFTTRSSTLTLVLAGVVIGAFFSALISLLTYIADVESELPAILYWLLGSFATANYAKVALLLFTVLPASVVIVGLSFRLNVMSLGESEAAALGLDVSRVRWSVLLAVTVIVAGAVAVAGVIGWVGLVVPHLARLFVGPSNRVLVPASALTGMAFLILVDTLCRSLTAAEIPLSVITALIGAPIFILLLRRAGGLGWSHD